MLVRTVLGSGRVNVTCAGRVHMVAVDQTVCMAEVSRWPLVRIAILLGCYPGAVRSGGCGFTTAAPVATWA